MNARLTATLSRLVMSFALGLGLVLGLIAFVHAPSLAAPAWRPLLIPGNPVVMPRANSHTAPRNTTVAITYSEAISAATVNTRTFAVHAMQTGQLTRSFGALGGSIILTPTRLFKPGELVQASATTRTFNLLGQGPISPTVWQFRAAAGPGPGIFLDSGQRMGLSFTLGVALGDLNGDGSLDALVTNFDQGDQVWLNNGAGLFTASGQSLPGTSSQAIALGDLNGDGDLDAVVGSKFDVTGTIWFNNGSGLFVDSGQTLILSETSAIALGDLNGDGALDAFVGNMNSYDFGCLPDPCPLSGGSQVWLNNGSGFLTASGPVLGFGSNNISVALGDVNGDGSLDALVGNQATQWTSGNWGGGETSVWLNNGSGVFTAMTPTLSLTSTTRAVALGDLNGDGDLDALVGNFLGPTQVYFNNGAGVFTNTGQTLGISATVSVALGDVDGDGDLDAVIGNDGEPKTVWLNDGTGTFIANGQVLAAENTTALALGDLNGDGNLDIFAANAGEGAPNTIWFNTNEFTAQDDQFTVLEDQLANVLNVLANDHTPTGTLSLLNVGAPNHGGNVVISATTLVYTPAVDYNGFESFTYTLQNTAGLTAIAWVTATILAVNDPPSFAKGTDRIVSEDAGQQVVASWATNIRSGPVTALDEAGQALTFTLTSNNAALFAGPLQLNTAGTLTYIPAANAFGSATVIAALRDEGGTLNGGVDTFSATFHITVTAVNDPPTLNPIGDRVISGSLQTQVITLTGISAGPNEMEPVSVTAISTNTAMLPQPTVVYTSPNTTGLLQITPSAGQSGTANVIVTVNDGLLQTSRTFQVTVNPSFFVVTTDPAGLNQIVQPTQSITATFSMPPNASTVNTRTFQVYGQQTGVYPGSYAIGSTFVRFTPAGGFKPGEAIVVHLGDALKALDGRSLIPYTWRFRVAAPNGLGLFVDSGQSLSAPNQSSSGHRPIGPQSALDSQGVALGDLNGDGYLDLFVGRNAITSTIWFNDGKGNFTPGTQSLFKSNVWASALGDVNGDGALDVYVANYNAPDQIWLNNGAGFFSDSGQRLGTSDSYAVALGDVDGDGDLDAWVGTGLAQANVVWLNNGSGVFTDSGQRLGYGASRAVALGDVNGDGSLDAVIGDANGLGSKVWLNNGAGQFTDSGQSLGNGHVYGLALGDVNGDGDLDVVLGDVNGSGNTVWFNTGLGSFSDSGQHLGNAATWAVSLSDINGDGDLDALFGNISLGVGAASNQVWLNNGSGTFSDSGQRLGTASTFAIAIGDVDRDGDLDAFAGNNNSLGQANQLWLNRPNAPHAHDDLFFVPRDSVNAPLDVLANDVYPDDGALSVSAIGQPTKGTATFNSASIIYRPTSGITGTDTFTYTVRGANNRIDTAQVTVLIFEQVQTTIVSPTQGGSLVHTNDQGSTTIVNIPAGAISQTLEFHYTPITTPTHPTTGTLQFAGQSFQLEAYQGGQLVPGIVFAQPITITIHYSDADVATLNPNTLQLRYWNGSAWVSDGITLVAHDPIQHWIMLRVTHLSEFALLGTPGWQLYLPLVRR